MTTSSGSQRSSRPLLKWAGGKRQLLPALQQYYPSAFARYIEPFFGSGAVFFDLYSSGRLAGRQAHLVDDNADLIGCYTMLRDEPDAVIASLRRLARGHAEGGADFYYEVRDGRFNPTRAAGRPYTPDTAAMLIYLNRTGFNGLFRLNRRGEFNVPAGRYVNPGICDEVHLRTVSAALRDSGITIERGSFERPLSTCRAGDFVYCDPPYAPLSRTASFAHYTAGGFDDGDQRRLQGAVIAAAERGAIVVLSNSSAVEIERLYSTANARRAGLRIRRVSARRAINCNAAHRGYVDELIVTNLPAVRVTHRTPALPARPSMLRAGLRRAVRKPA